MLASLKCVDYAIIAPVPTLGKIPIVEIINELRPNIFTTTDSRFRDYAGDLVKKGVIVRSVTEERLDSTTDIINRIRSL